MTSSIPEQEEFHEEGSRSNHRSLRDAHHGGSGSSCLGRTSGALPPGQQ
jgi:hypothetical protein